ncbi:transporter substrate-binding domain-containing protein [Treponema endosymbiont of Eucomonympha sp.]|uniref:transporter substrate-binding domain-containing protein n=1 Tax=Treponema endosymbiont of Eucomonympha sp. TaxID=1580831 RepID=UPI0007515F46|nr:transporter substrate-binding domain-containing protein [Treponema endosymbiont of Eucomonympha sp.]
MKAAKRIIAAALVFAAAMSVNAAGKAKTGKAKTQEIIIGAGSAYKPYWYLDENNKLTGFEKALLDEIDARHPEFTLKYQVQDFANILLSLESGKIDIAVHQYEYNIERAQKYLYGTVGYTTFPQHLGVRENDFSINSFEDLKGKTVVLTSTTANAYYVTNKWNEDHGRPFKIIFESTFALACEDIASGKADAIVSMIRNLESFNKEYNAHLRIVQPLVNASDTYYLFNKKAGAGLQKTFDAALKELKDDGTMKKLSLEWLGGDFTAK